MEFVWLGAPLGVCLLAILGFYCWVPLFRESRAEQLLRMGRDRQAAAQFHAALKVWTRRRGGRRTIDCVPALAGLARTHFLQDDSNRCAQFLNEAVSLMRADKRRPSRRLLRASLRVGQAALVACRYTEATEFAEKAAALGARLLSRTDPEGAEIEVLIANAYSAQELFERAHVHYQNALDIYESGDQENSVGCGRAMSAMAASLLRQERWREAREASIEAVEILDSSGNASLPEALDVLADLHALRGNLLEAEGLRVSICHLRERLSGRDSAVLAREYERRAELLESMERRTEAGFLLAKARRIRKDLVAAA
jgi:tetratricopeptide (TPR) repeat protein